MIQYRSSMPQIDLHGEDRINASILVKSFINDNYKVGNEEFAIIHGIGKGILKKEVYNVLKKDKRVVEFGTDYFNMGCTLVRIYKKIDKESNICYNMQHESKGE